MVIGGSDLADLKPCPRYGQHVKTFSEYDARDLLRLARDDIVQMVTTAALTVALFSTVAVEKWHHLGTRQY